MDKKLDEAAASKATVHRRALLGTGAAVVGAGLALQSGSAKAAKLSGRTFTLAGVGESMVTRPFAVHTEPEFLGIVKLLRDADVSYAHIETNFAHDEEIKWGYRGSSGGAGYLVGDPQCAKDLAFCGVDAVSLAHNHTLDWGPEGMLATIKHCREAGLAVAGTGINLEEARSPGYFDTDHGRVAMISVASGNSAFEWAGHPKGKVPGRPGVNAMRLRTVYEVPRETAAQLKAAGKGLGVLSDANAAKPEFNITPGAISGSNGFSGFVFKEGEKFEIHSEAHPVDLAGNLRAVHEAHDRADFVMVAHHNSTSEGSRSKDPSDFVIDFARKAIDAGADVYLGHGWHTFLGVEIYKGKPILYGMGSFFVQSQYIDRVPADAYESYNFDLDELTTLHAASGNLHPGDGNPDWGWSAVFQMKYVDNKISEIVLHPIEMGFDYTGDKPRRSREVGVGWTRDGKGERYLDGSPRLATGANARKILEMMQQVCARRGTTMTIRGLTGVITA